MLKIYNFNEREWQGWRDAMLQRGYVPRVQYSRSAPASVARVWSMGRYYITDQGERVWPWVIWPGADKDQHCGYVLDVPPLPPAPSKQEAPRARPQRPPGRAARAAMWFRAQEGQATRQEAAARFGISLPALCVALKRSGRE